MAVIKCLAVLAVVFSAANACPSSTTSTPCPTTASGSTTCASGSQCVTTAQACTDSTKSCQTTVTYQLCNIASTSGTGTMVATNVKFCLANAAVCTSLTGALQTTTAPTSYTTFTDCCTATTTTAANIRYEYIPLSPTPTLACIAGADATPYKVAVPTATPATPKAGYCTRFPYTAASTDAMQSGTSMGTVAPANTFAYTSFTACCAGIMGGNNGASPAVANVNSWGTVTAYGLTLEKCISVTQ